MPNEFLTAADEKHAIEKTTNGGSATPKSCNETINYTTHHTTPQQPSTSAQPVETGQDSTATNSNDRADNKPSKWLNQRAKRKRRKHRKKERKQQLMRQQVKTQQTHELLNKPKPIEMEYISEPLNEAAKKNFGAAFARFTPAEDLFKSQEQLLQEAADRDRLEQQHARVDPIDAAIAGSDDARSHRAQANHNSGDGASSSALKANVRGGGEAHERNNDDDYQPLSNKQKKLLLRPNIAFLKKAVARSDLVEEHDVNAPDPQLLIELKSMRNTVQVPAHWLQKRKYLQGKRGFLKPPFKLPSYIEATGITKMRENRLDLLSDKSMKQKQRERMRPKAGGCEIAYDILHDAFARHQTKPENLTGFGDLYYEGKEMRVRFRKFKPGFVSDRLKKALGMTPRYRVVSPSGVMVRNQKEDVETGDVQWYNVQELKYGQYVVWDGDAGANRIKICAPVTGFVWLTSKDNKEEKLKRCDVEDPPPWLINMQRFGPPPSYPDLKIAGLNAPIPSHKMYGFHEGQWGKPPVDEHGQPLYGDPFGIWTEPISRSWGGRSRWGVLEKFEESSEEEEEESDGEEEEVVMTTKGMHKQMVNGEEMNGGTQHEANGDHHDQKMQIPSQMNLRKNTVIDPTMSGIETPTSMVSTQEIAMRNAAEDEHDQALYQVLSEKDATVAGKFGSSKVYQIPSAAEMQPPPAKKRRQN